MASYLFFFFLPMTSSLKRTTGRSWNTKFSSCTDALTSVAVLDRRTVQKDLQRSLSSIAGTNQSISNRPTLETCFVCVDVCGSMCVCVCVFAMRVSVCLLSRNSVYSMHAWILAYVFERTGNLARLLVVFSHAQIEAWIIVHMWANVCTSTCAYLICTCANI